MLHQAALPSGCPLIPAVLPPIGHQLATMVCHKCAGDSPSLEIVRVMIPLQYCTSGSTILKILVFPYRQQKNYKGLPSPQSWVHGDSRAPVSCSNTQQKQEGQPHCSIYARAALGFEDSAFANLRRAATSQSEQRPWTLCLKQFVVAELL